MKKLLGVLLVVFMIAFVAMLIAMVVMPRVAKLDAVAVVADAATGYGANSERHRNAKQLATPWDPIGDANRAMDLIPFEDRSYPLFAEADAMMRAVNVREKLSAEAGEEGWEDVAAWIETEEAQSIVGVLLEAVAKPESGFPLSDVEGKGWDDAAARHGILPSRDIASPNPIIIEILLPAVGTQRNGTLLLLADAEVGRASGDVERFVRDHEAAIGTTRHVYPLNFLIVQLVDYVVLQSVRDSIERVLLENPAFITEGVAARLERALEAAEAGAVHTLDTSDEAVFFEDLIRRYVDDRGVYNGLGTTDLYSVLSDEARATKPGSVVTESINADLLASYQVHLYWADRAEDSAARPYSPMSGYYEAIEAWVDQTDSRPGRVGREIIGNVTPAWPNAVAKNRESEQQITALRVALAAHRHRLRHGDPPLGLSDIDDDLLTFDPIDGFTGGPMQFRWRDGRALVYTFGPDRDDDGGRHVPNKPDGEAWRGISDELLEAAPDGDFVLFPTPDE